MVNCKLKIYYSLLDTKAGWIGLAATESGLIKLTLPCQYREEAVLKLMILEKDAINDDLIFKDIRTKLINYFLGGLVVFDDKIDYLKATEFEIKVLAAARKISYGETRSYQWIAGMIGKPKAARAVGNALGKNPCPIIIPCHRVLASDGKLGGFSGGLEIKRMLLDLESSR